MYMPGFGGGKGSPELNVPDHEFVPRLVEQGIIKITKKDQEHYLSKTDVTSVATGRGNDHYICYRNIAGTLRLRSARVMLHYRDWLKSVTVLLRKRQAKSGRRTHAV